MASATRYTQAGDWFFKECSHGVKRIHEIPKNALVAQYNPARDEDIRRIFECYQESILKLVGHFDHDPLECCLKFSSTIKASNLHLTEEFSLAERKLAYIPPQIGLFRNLKRLDLSNNNLRQLFPELPSFTSLEELDISGNQGIAIPDLRGLKNLRVLKAKNCGLVAVPDWIWECRMTLKKVDFRSNPIGFAEMWYFGPKDTDLMIEVDNEPEMPSQLPIEESLDPLIEESNYTKMI